MIDVKETIKTLLAHTTLKQGLENGKWVYRVNGEEVSEDEFKIVLNAIKHISEN